MTPAGGSRALTAPAWHTTVDPHAAEALARRRAAALVEGVPLAGGTTATFRVTPVEVFAPDARVVEFDGVTARSVGRPDVSVYEGEDASAAGRRIVLAIIDGSRVWALVREGTAVVTVIHPSDDGSGASAHAVVDPRQAPALGQVVCTNPEAAAGELVPPSTKRAIPNTSAAGSPGGAFLAADVLVDVGYDLYTQLGASTTAASTYTANVFGAVSAIYRRDIRVAILIGQLVI